MSDEKKSNSKIKKLIMNRTFNVTIVLGAMVLIFITVICGAALVFFRPYTITLDLADESEPMTETYNLNSGDITLGIPTRQGYHFTGWTGSNGSKPERDVIIKGGQLGNFSYTANWSDDLEVICQDWIVDENRNLIREITDEVDSYLKAGKSSKKYTAQNRTIQVKPGTVVNGTKWGEDRGYKAYHDQYMYIGSSGDVTVNEDAMVVYRYFYPILNVDYSVDGSGPENNADMAFFDLYVNGNLVASDVCDFCSAAVYGGKFEVVIKNVNPKYECVETGALKGTIWDSRVNYDIPFSLREGSCEVTCEDWLIDKHGNKIRDITREIDSFLAKGSSSRKYPLLDRTVSFAEGDKVSGELWGNDTGVNAYHNAFVYVKSSKPVTVTEEGATVYRFFYPVLNVNCDIDGNVSENTNNIARFNVVVDGKTLAESVTDFYEGVPCKSKYKIDITEYTDWSYVRDLTYSDKAEMGKYNRTIDLKLSKRSGDYYVMVEDWVVDADNNRIEQITDKVDEYLEAGGSTKMYVKQNRALKAKAGEVIRPELFGNDSDEGAYIADYVYIGASEDVVVSGNTTIYRYFRLASDVNADGNMR